MPAIKVPFDSELEEILKNLPRDNSPVTEENIPRRRGMMAAMASLETIATDPSIVHESRAFTGPNGKIEFAIFRLKDGLKGPRPAIYYIHGGAMIMGTRFLGVNQTFEWIKELDIVVISVEYRLAPEHPDPAPIEDCYAGFKWLGEHTSDLGIIPEKIMICGQSAGGGLAAGLALLVRDRGGPKILAQCLICPMIDDRMITASSQQYMTLGLYTGESNLKAWNWLLDGKQGAENVSIYAVPARATDLSNLPPTWIDVGSAELFRDENVAYATKLWEAGVQAELHVWSGGWHAFDLVAPQSKLAKVCVDTRFDWIRRILAGTEPQPKSAQAAAML